MQGLLRQHILRAILNKELIALIIIIDKKTYHAFNARDIKKLMKEFPKQKEYIWNAVLSNADFLERNYFDLMMTLPDYRQCVFNLTVAQPNFLQKHYASSSVIIKLTEIFPRKKDFIFKETLADHDFFIRLTRDYIILGNLLKNFATYREEIFNLVMCDLGKSSGYIKNLYTLRYVCQLFPEYNGYLFENTVLNQELFPSKFAQWEVGTLFKMFPSKKSILLSLCYIHHLLKVDNLQAILDECPEYKEEIFNYLAFDRNRMYNLIDCSYKLQIVINAFPEKKEFLYEMTVGNPDHFRRYIKSICDLMQLATLFPDNKIFKTSSVSMAENMLHREFYNKAMLLCLNFQQGKKQNHSLIFALPNDVLKQIYAYVFPGWIDENERKKLCGQVVSYRFHSKKESNPLLFWHKIHPKQVIKEGLTKAKTMLHHMRHK